MTRILESGCARRSPKGEDWRYLVDTFRNGEAKIGVSLNSIQSLFLEFEQENLFGNLQEKLFT